MTFHVSNKVLIFYKNFVCYIKAVLLEEYYGLQ